MGNTAWDLSRLRKIAGTTLTESIDDNDDDDMTPAEKALAAKADADLKKAGVKVKKINPEKDLSKLASQRKAKDETDDETEEKDESDRKPAKVKAEKQPKSPWDATKDKKVEAPAEKAEKEKSEEKKPDEKKEETIVPASKKAPQAVAWIKANPGAKRGEFLKWAAANLQMGTAYGSTLFAKHNPKSSRGTQVAETFYVLTHPSVSTFMLAENRFNGGSYLWIDASSNIDPLVFTNESEAKKLAKYMEEWKGQQTVVETVTL